jgi:hypothetical protein
MRFHLDGQGWGDKGPYIPLFIANRNTVFAKTILELEGLEYHWCSCPDKYHIIRVGSEVRCNNDESSVILDTDITEYEYHSESEGSENSDTYDESDESILTD